MYVLGKEELNQMDQYTIEVTGLPGAVLMENAGARVVEEILSSFPKKDSILILAGGGNNGGDGFVIGRKLLEAGKKVEVCLCVPPEKLKGDALLQYRVYLNRKYPLRVLADRNRRELNQLINNADLLVDALLGTGFNGKVRSPLKEVMEEINQRSPSKPLLAVDIPSGVCSETGKVGNVALKADLTITFVCPKKGFFLPPGYDYIGQWKAVDISVPVNLVQKLDFSVPRLITPDWVAEQIPKRKVDGHKGSFGHVLVVGGSRTMVGAPLFSAKAALRCGAGLVTMAIPDGIYAQVSTQLPAAMFLPVEEESGFFGEGAISQLQEKLALYDVLAIGPGMGRWSKGDEWLHSFLLISDRHPLIIDADGLYHLPLFKDVLQERSSPLLLTPHPGEMARLMQVSVREVEENRLSYAQKAAVDYQSYVLLKGYNSVMATPQGEVYINQTGNDSLAKGGSGDVLTGMIAAFLAQGALPHQAVTVAAYLHGYTGEKLGEKQSHYSLLPDDLIGAVGGTIRKFM